MDFSTVAFPCPFCREPSAVTPDAAVVLSVSGRPHRCTACGGDVTVRLSLRVFAHVPSLATLDQRGGDDEDEADDGGVSLGVCVLEPEPTRD